MIVVVLPAVAALLPGVELNPALALVPVLNTSLVSKEIITGTYHWGYIALIFAVLLRLCSGGHRNRRKVVSARRRAVQNLEEGSWRWVVGGT